MNKKFFPYGCHIYREPSLPIEEIKNDLKILKKLGFNMVKIQQSWAIDEKNEGEIDISRIEKIIKDTERLNLYVYFGFTLEQAPAWLWKKYPDAYLIYNDGTIHKDPTQYLLPADGKPGPCWNNPGIRKEAERFLREVIKKISKYKNIIAWNIWQEIGFWPMYPGKIGFCYCQYTLDKFRKWLEEKYGSLEKLNETWKTGFGNWNEIEPPRYYSSVPSIIDFKYYMNNVYLAEVLKFKYKVIKENDEHNRPIFAHVAFPYIGSGQDWKFAESIDFYGCSVYPDWSVKDRWDKNDYSENEIKLFQMWNNISFKFDYIRSACMGKKYWAAEFQGGPIVSFLNRGRVPNKEDIRRWVLTALSTGINGLCFWNHKEEIFWQEAYGFGLIDFDGKLTERAKESGKISKIINKYGEIFSEGKMEDNEFAILIDEDKFNFLECIPIKEGKATQHLIYTIRGIYKFLWKNGIWVDFLNKEYIENINKYKIVFLPFPISIDDKTFEKLKKYVEEGGVLISEACPGRYTKYGFARKEKIIDPKFWGVEHKNLFMVREKGINLWTAEEPTWIEYVNCEYLEGEGQFYKYRVLPNLYIQTFKCFDGEEILIYKRDTCGVVKKYGEGKVFLIGTLLGHSILTYEDKDTEKFLEKLLDSLNLRKNKIGKVLYRKKIYKKDEILFLINPTNEKVSLKIGDKYIDIFEKQYKKELLIEPLSVKILKKI
ncbi:MAG: beta-galactosidase [bacterium]|nr:beta-galactosidase [bacterium]